jgi:heat-inducible transcriptional repressor
LSEEINQKIISGKFSKAELTKILDETTAFPSGAIEIEEAIERELYTDIEGKLFFNNASSIIDTQGIDAQETMKIFGDDHQIKNLFKELVNKKEKNYGAVNVIFGDEINQKGLEDFSFVFSIYTIGDAKGVIGVIGPKRMEYSKTVSLVDYVSDEVKKLMKKIE